MTAAAGRLVPGDDTPTTLRALRTALLAQIAAEHPRGLRAAWGYLGQCCLRRERWREALLAFQASLDAPAESEDREGFTISLRGQAIAFARLGEGAGLLATTKMLEDRAALEDLPGSEQLLRQLASDEQRDAAGQLLGENAQLQQARLSAIVRARTGPRVRAEFPRGQA